MKERDAVDETESFRKLEGERRHSKTEEEEEKKKKSWGKQRKKYCTDWWMDRTVGGGARRFLSGEWGDGARPLTSDYTESPLLSLFLPLRAWGQESSRLAVSACVCVYVYINACVCVCAPCLFQHIVPSNTKR